MIISMSASTLTLVAILSVPLQAVASLQESIGALEGRQSFRASRGMQAMLQRSHREMQTRAALPSTGLRSALLQLESFSESTDMGAAVMIIILLLTVCIVAGVMIMVFSRGETDARGEPIRKRAMSAEDPFLVNSYPSTPGSAQVAHKYPPTLRSPGRSPLLSARSNLDVEYSGLSTISERTSGNLPATGSTLCPELVLPSSMTYKINGTIEAREQQETFEVTEQSGAVLALLYIFEDGRDSGVLLESSSRVPLAFVDTSTAQLAKGSPNSLPYVSISKASPIVGGRGAQKAFAFVARRDNNLFSVCQGRLDGPMMLSVRVMGQKSEIVDTSDRICASFEFNWGTTSLHVQQGVDAGVALCTMIAAMKLGAQS
mmetsp:Transcript_42431/g.79646  ORF Transcript_42431/g.79646 Transcript_42431/m.79646 type:complete len:373 (+) Transcript_42431:73-1191(+)